MENTNLTAFFDNPWSTFKVGDFAFFCCPECEFKSKKVPSFIAHASENHPNAKDFCDFQFNEIKADQSQNLQSNRVKFDPSPNLPSKKVKFEPSTENVLYLGEEDYFANENHVPEIEMFEKVSNQNGSQTIPNKKRKITSVKDDIHSEFEELLHCTDCDTKLPSLLALSEHNMIKHQKDQNTYICPVCQYVTKDGKRGIRGHIRRKHQSLRVSCPECNRMIKDSNLKAHMESTHSKDKEKRFKCLECAFESNNPTSFSNHVKCSHPKDPGQLPYSCEKCSRAFPYASGKKLPYYLNREIVTSNVMGDIPFRIVFSYSIPPHYVMGLELN